MRWVVHDADVDSSDILLDGIEPLRSGVAFRLGNSWRSEQHRAGGGPSEAVRGHAAPRFTAYVVWSLGDRGSRSAPGARRNTLWEPTLPIGLAVSCPALGAESGERRGSHLVSQFRCWRARWGTSERAPHITGELEQRIIADLEESLMVPEGSPAPRCTIAWAVQRSLMLHGRLRLFSCPPEILIVT
jgi:hypothetical protein